MQITIAQAAGVYPLPSDWYTLMDLLNGTTIVERVNESKINLLNSSLLTAPSEEFPAYVFQPTPSPASNLSNSLRVYPNTIVGNLTLQYIRYPKDPKWTYSSLTLGEPIFDQSQPDYQDFELPLSDYDELVTRILKYSGLSIRELDIVKDANATEILTTQTEV